MIVNSTALLSRAPIKNMIGTKEKSGPTTYGMGQAGYDIRIKQDILFSKYANGKPYVRAWTGDKVSGENDGRFILASAIEEFDMPGDLIGIVHDKSTWARRGLSLFNTVIESGWNGYLTLELTYNGEEDLHIPAGSGIAQVVFHDLMVPAYYTGRYQGQADEPVAAKLIED